MSKYNKSKKGIYGFFVCILLLQLINMIYWGIQKEGYYIDELWSYGLSNGYYTPFLQDSEDYLNQWQAPDFYKEYLVVEEGQGFKWDSVYYNQTQDVHPPFYYFVLHFICSFFPGSFSKWYGLGLNIVCFAFIIWLIFCISRQCMKNCDGLCLVPVLCYGFCVGAISEVMYIRMYTMFSLWILMFVYLTCCLVENLSERKKHLLQIGIMFVTIGGFLTQYFFSIFVFFCTLAYTLMCLMKKEWRKLFEYAGAVVAGALGGVLLFPSSIYQIFVGKKGQDVFGNLGITKSEIVHRLRCYGDILVKQLWGICGYEGKNVGLIILLMLGLFCALVMLFLTIYKKKSKNTFKDEELLGIEKWWIIGFATVGYFLVVTVISTDLSDRYQYPIYSLIIILVFSGLIMGLKFLKRERLVWVLVCIFLILNWNMYGKEHINYLYQGYSQALNTMKEKYQGVPGIYVTAGDHLVINNCLFLASQNNTYPLPIEKLSDLPNIVTDRKEELVVYVDIYFDEFAVAKQVAEILEYSCVEELYNNQFTTIFVLK